MFSSDSATLLAYIDPGTGSLVLQVVVGAAVGLMVTAKLYWVRIKDFFRSRGDSTPENKPDDQPPADQL
jgi:hypothetical protein